MDRRYDAVIFDLFGTLVNNITDADYHTCLRETAQLLGIAGDAFIAFWIDDEFRRMRRCGVLPSTAAQMEHVCRRFAIPITAETIAQAVMLQRTRFGLDSLTPRPGTLDTLTRLRQHGYALGLISDCSWEVPDVWAQTAFAPIFSGPVFSCEAGVKKPDARLYRLACDQLGVAPTRCLYVGDGDGRELTGACQAGMDAVLLCAPDERDIVMQREDPRQWDGPVIARIDELLHRLDHRR